MLVDTHAHLYAKQFDDDREEMMQRAIKAGVTKFYLPNIDTDSIEGMLALEAAYPNQCFATMGIHPCSIKKNYKKELSVVEDWLGKRDFCAIGEIGIDLYWDKTFFEEQKKAFITQLNWAKELRKPIIIHARESLDILIDLVAEHKDDRLQGIFHCFGGTMEQAKKIMDLEFYMGIGGVMTFKKTQPLRDVLKEITLDHIVLETDAPYLAPAPHRGKRNEAAYVRIIAEKLAEVKNMELSEIGEITTKNAKKVFKM